MTVELINDSRRFICKSTDSFPQHLTGRGAKLTVTDTGEKYIWTGEEWELDMTLVFAVRTAIEETRLP